MNGDNQPLVFTRQDSERLVRIEQKIDEVMALKNQVVRNTTTIKLFKWLTGISGSIFIALKALGLL